MSHRVLTKEQIEEAKRLKNERGYTKRQLAVHFEVGETTIWENVFHPERKRKRKRFQVYLRRVCIPCAKCEVCLTLNVLDGRIPLNYKIGNVCLVCYLRSVGLNYTDLLDVE